jgi:hypothetical protein
MRLPKFFSVVLTMFMIVAFFSGCNKDTAITWKDLCFEADAVALPGEDFKSVNSSAYNGEKFIISTYTTDYPEDIYDYDNYKYHYYLITADEKNGITKKTELPARYNYLYAAKDGTVYGIEISSQDYVDDNGRPYTSETYHAVTIDEELNVTRVLDLGAIVGEFIPNLSYAYIADFKADTDGNIYLLANGDTFGIEAVTGKLFLHKKASEVNGAIRGFVESPDGKMQIIMYEYNITSEETSRVDVIKEINTSDGSFGDPVPFPAEDKTFSGGNKYPYYTYNASYIYGLNPKTSEKTVVANLLEAGSASLEIWNIIYDSDEKFAVRASDASTLQIGIYMLNKLDPKDVPDKKTLTVGAVYTSFWVDYYIKEFNRKSDEYKAELITYATNEGSTRSERLTNFNAKFAAGDTPDLLIVDRNMDYHGYAAKNMFKDLYPLIDEDPDVKREDLVQSVMKAHETEGKLFSISPNYSIVTLIGKTEIFGEKKGQSLAELQAAAAVYSDASLFAADETASAVLTKIVVNSISDYVNYETGECYFDTPDFISLLEAAKKYPVDVSIVSNDYNVYLGSIVNNRTLLFETSIGSFRDISEAEHAFFDAPVTFLGYPSKNGGTYAYINAYNEVAILSDTEYPDGAWEFVKEFMKYKGPMDTESSMYSKLLSVWQENMDNYAADALYDPYYIDYSTGEKVHRGHATMVNNQILPLPKNTPEDNERIIELINSVTDVYRVDTDIIQIISDDADTFFRGQKSAEDTAEMIQNRVSTYLAEKG